MPSISEAATTSSFNGIFSSSMSIPTFDFEASSFNAFAIPPLVGSFIAVTPPILRAASTIPQTGATSDLRSVSNPNPSL